jgi:hypothetical protein
MGEPCLRSSISSPPRSRVGSTRHSGARRRLSAGELREALFLLPHLVRRAGQRPSIRVETWDGVPAAASEVADDLAALGCIRDDQAMVLYRSFRGPA